MKPGKDYIGSGVGAMIFNDKGELLLLKRGPAAKNERGCWQIPGGGVDFSETMAQAITREVNEEIGVDVVIDHQLVTIDHIIPAENQHWITTTFIAHIKGKKLPKISEPTKHSDLGWFPLSKLPEPLAITARPGLKAYERYLKSASNQVI